MSTIIVTGGAGDSVIIGTQSKTPKNTRFFRGAPSQKALSNGRLIRNGFLIVLRLTQIREYISKEVKAQLASFKWTGGLFALAH